jgi:TetR/AcrR family transcriptional regulator, transcriptional repressor for nem operon
MAPKTAARLDTRTALLKVGMDIMLAKGYSNTGISEVLTTLGVHKGSFYYYFDSKETFAVEIIRHFDREYSAHLASILRNEKRRPIERLRDYCEEGKQSLADKECRGGCLIGNLSQEMSDQSEVLRTELCGVMTARRALFAECIAQAQAAGEIGSPRDPAELAEVFCSAWAGALMFAKTVKNTGPLDVVMELLFNEVLKP